MIRPMKLLRRLFATVGHGSPTVRPRRPRAAAPQLDSLEGRVVLSRLGIAGHGVTRLAATQVEQSSTASTSLGLISGASATCNGRGIQDAQLQADQQTLRTDLNAVVAGSSVTDAQRLTLRNDFRAIANASVTVDRTALATVADNLLTSIANGTYDADASTLQAAFTAAFSGTNGAALTTDQTALVTTAYNDFVTVAKGLNVDTTELSKLSADRTAIQADLTRLGIDTTSGYGQSSSLDLILGSALGGGGRGRGRHGR